MKIAFTIFYSFIFVTCASICKGDLLEKIGLNDPSVFESFTAKANLQERLRKLNEIEKKLDGSEDPAFLINSIIGTASMEDQISLSAGFLLARPKLADRFQGARYILNAVVAGTPVSSPLREMAITSLVASLKIATSNEARSYEFYMEAAKALMVLNSDIGLDIFLTNRVLMENLQLKDQWNFTSPSLKFSELSKKYSTAYSSGSGNLQWNCVYSHFYFLASERAVSGGRIQSLNPIVNLEAIKK